MLEKKEDKSVIFVSKARGLKIANFIPEKKVGGRIDQREVSLGFTNHLHVTSDSKEIKFIRDYISKGNIDVREFENIKDAQSYILGLEKVYISQLEGKVESKHTEQTEYKDKKSNDEIALEIAKAGV